MSHKIKHFLSLAALLAVCFSLMSQASALAQSEQGNTEQVSQEKAEEGFDISKIIFGHVNDAYEWHLVSFGSGAKIGFHLPVLLYSPSKGFFAFSSSHFDNETHPDHYKGFHIEGGNKILADDGTEVFDFSITKTVLAMFIAMAIMLWLFISTAKKYKNRGADKAPTGLQNAVEVCITFVRDDIAKPALGADYKRFMPLLLTLFFFIWFANTFGLIPGGANVTGNIAVTCCLSIITFVVMLFTSKKFFWGHTFNPPGMPILIKIILVPIELISLLIKPTALMIRLFANMLAGHIVLVCFVLLIFIFSNLNVFIGGSFSIVSVALSVFSMLIELLVAGIQAYIFAFLTAIFVAQMIERPHHVEAESAVIGNNDLEPVTIGTEVEL